MRKFLSMTQSVCPVCLARIPAARKQDGDDIYLEKYCEQHGAFRAVIWRGSPAFSTWARPKTPAHPANPLTEAREGCPFDCGLCPDHRQHPCCVLLEVTQRCNLGCPVCFADAAHNPSPDLSIEEISAWYRRLLDCGGPFNIQLSGGEPCLRDDLPEIIRLGRRHGFEFFQLNTNGLRLSVEKDYLAALRDAGLSTVFLQFDGTDDAVYRAIRGRDLLSSKMAAIENCEQVGVGVVLVPTLIPGINIEDIGNILRLALAHAPNVRGVHFQPVSYFGRYPTPPTDDMRITIPEVIRAIEQQTGGLIAAASFCPPGGENALCSFHGNYVQMKDGSLVALTRHKEDACCCQPTPAAEGAKRSREFVAAHWSRPEMQVEAPASPTLSLGEWDAFLERKRTHTFCVSGMAFQDAWTLDLGRLKDCYIHVASPENHLVPFCAYNLTDQQGRSLYRQPHEPHPA